MISNRRLAVAAGAHGEPGRPQVPAAQQAWRAALGRAGAAAELPATAGLPAHPAPPIALRPPQARQGTEGQAGDLSAPLPQS